MPQYLFGDVVILPFSYTDLMTAKRRPALVLLDADDGDIVVARITSKKNDSPFDLAIQNWQEAGLLSTSFARLHKLSTISKTHIIKNLKRLSETDLQKIRSIFSNIIAQ
jgi:mRNA interferase MazF